MKHRKDIGNVDAALEKLGIMGRYTMIQFSMQVFTQVAVGHHMLSIVFTGQKNPFRCPTSFGNNSDPGALGSLHASRNLDNTSRILYDSICHSNSNEEIYDSAISNATACNAFNVEYELPKDRFFTSEFDLICDREHLASLAQTLLTLGHAIGSLLFPYFADNYGRKPILLLTSLLWLGSALGLAFSVNYAMFAVFKTLVGIFLQGCAQTAITVMIEILTASQRGFMFTCLGYVFWTLGIILMVPVAYLLRDHSWRALEFSYCGYFIFIFFYIFFMDESLRWLAANGMREKVIKILEKASKWNGTNIETVIAAFYKDNETEMNNFDNHEALLEIHNGKNGQHIPASGKESVSVTNLNVQNAAQNGVLTDSEISDENLNCLSLVRESQLRLSTGFSILAWFFNSLTYYALFLMSSSLSGSIYFNYFLNCVVELPSAAFIYFYIDRLGRKVCFTTFSLIAGLSLVSMAITSAVSDQHSTVITVFAIVGKFGISGSFAAIFTMTPELLPTTIRNTGVGVANLSACIGGMLAPFSGLLMSKVVYAPGLIFGSGSLILSAWAFFLPETAKRQLPQSLKDIKMWSQQRTDKNNNSDTVVLEGNLNVISLVSK